MTQKDEVQTPPIAVEPEGVKPELRKTGHRWLDLTIALAAITLSLISLAVAIGNARTQEKMVAAATWPLLQYGTTNNQDGKPVIRMTVSNTGVGPALIGEARMRYAGRDIEHWPAFLAACCGLTREIDLAVDAEGAGGSYTTSRLGRNIIRPGEDVDILQMRRTPANAAVYDRLDRERFKLEFDTCYCSVFDECWRSDLQGLKPKRVRSCSEPASR